MTQWVCFFLKRFSWMSFPSGRPWSTHHSHCEASKERCSSWRAAGGCPWQWPHSYQRVWYVSSTLALVASLIFKCRVFIEANVAIAKDGVNRWTGKPFLLMLLWMLSFFVFRTPVPPATASLVLEEIDTRINLPFCGVVADNVWALKSVLVKKYNMSSRVWQLLTERKEGVALHTQPSNEHSCL